MKTMAPRNIDIAAEGRPATLSLLTLGGLAVSRRRLVTTKPPGEDGKRRASE